jgi:predicted DCC family thiol-disulfide oxidoreductase YuxK
MESANLQQPIIFFGGVCGMCNTFVDLVLRVDRNRPSCLPRCNRECLYHDWTCAEQ